MLRGQQNHSGKSRPQHLRLHWANIRGFKKSGQVRLVAFVPTAYQERAWKHALELPGWARSGVTLRAGSCGAIPRREFRA
jgi:hypothetical protein